MKKLSFFLVAIFISSFSFAQDGIAFQHDKSWSEVLELAKESDKLVFVDAYTTWCGPCKKMTKEVFPQKSVGDYYNANFISVKIDMEKGEGPELAQLYQVRAYPTLLFISAAGELVHRKAGYMVAEEFISLGEEANDPSRTLSGMDAKFADGNREPDFLRQYTEASFNAANGGHSIVASEYLNTQKDWETEENMQFIFQYIDNADSKAFDYIIKNRKQFEDYFGKPMVTQKVQGLIYSLIYYTEPAPTIDDIKGIFQRYFPEKADVLYANYKMSYYRQLGDRDGYAEAAVERFTKYDVEDYAELNETAWTFFQVIDDVLLLEKALGWAKQSVKMAKRYENMDTVAHLYYKLGNKKKAKCHAKKAIKLAKKSGDDTEATQQLLDKIDSEG
jgi:thioredoxin-related protein